LQSRFATAPSALQAQIRNQVQAPGGVTRLARARMEGFVNGSPFVSVTNDPAAAAASTDPWMQSIARGAPHLSEFRVPSSRSSGL
jgi:hypothetical protein